MSDSAGSPLSPLARGGLLRGWLDHIDLDRGELSRGWSALRDYQRRVHRWFTISALMGLVIGITVGWLSQAIDGAELQWSGLNAPLLFLVLPGIGLAVTWQVLRLVPDRSGATTEAYIGSFHARTGRLRIRDLWGRVLATFTTIASGGALGLEGPGILVGGTVGSHVQARFARLFAGEEARLLMVAGAAAGVAATFRAPVTGLIFAIEVPYKDDIARHAVLPALIASATGYLGQAIVVGSTAPLLPLANFPLFRAIDVLGATVVGIAAGFAARLFVRALRAAERRASTWTPLRRILVGGSALGILGSGSYLLWDHPYALGLGYDGILAVNAASFPDSRGPFTLVWALVLFLVVRGLAVIATIIGGGVGGVFTSLVLMGATTGAICARLLVPIFPDLDVALFPLVGMAGFLGAGYHTPLAAVAFVAETTGSPNYIVAGLIAAAVAYGVIGRHSVSSNQRTARRGRAEAILDVPVHTAIQDEPVTVPPDTTIDHFADHFLLGFRHREFPVAQDGVLLGIITIDHLREIDHELWHETLVGDVMLRDLPVLHRDMPLKRAAEIMNRQGLDRVPVTDEAGRVIGMIGPRDVFRLGEILEDIEASRGGIAPGVPGTTSPPRTTPPGPSGS